MPWRIRAGQHIGRDHLLYNRNCQDGITVFDGKIKGEDVMIGVLCDGCSGSDKNSGRYSEVGARAATPYLVQTVKRLLEKDTEISLIPVLLWDQLIGWLRRTIDEYQLDEASKAQLIANYFLFTVVGMIVTDRTIVFFSVGDGIIVIDKDVRILDCNNTPPYPAYHCADKRFLTLTEDVPQGFEVLLIDRATSPVRRVAIGTDAWHHEQELLTGIWGHEHIAGLQRFINAQSNNERHFSDDVTMITWEDLGEQENS
jgi:Protein phosphatase 2C